MPVHVRYNQYINNITLPYQSARNDMCCWAFIGYCATSWDLVNPRGSHKTATALRFTVYSRFSCVCLMAGFKLIKTASILRQSMVDDFVGDLVMRSAGGVFYCGMLGS